MKLRAGGPAASGVGNQLVDEVEVRKGQHLKVVSSQDVESKIGPGWPDIQLVHQAIPTTDLASIDLSTDLLGRRLRAPLVIGGMTGGHHSAIEVNAVLARAAEEYGIAMGVGSQRAALRNRALSSSYAVAREAAPTAFLIGNLGAAQLVPQGDSAAMTPQDIKAATEMIHADAMAIHLNFLEEAVQTEGDRQARRLREALSAAVESLTVPAIAKETGAGMSREMAVALAAIGFRALDVGGRGGTSFAAVEGHRAVSRGDARGARLGEVYREWGIPTAVSVVAANSARLPVIATGGIRTGLDAAKAIALGATAVGVARPLLMAALEGDASVDAWISGFLEELRVAVFLCGSSSVRDLHAVPKVVGGWTRRWLEDLGYRPASRIDQQSV